MVTAGAYALDAFRNVAQSGGFERIVLVADWTHFTVRGEGRFSERSSAT